MIRAPKNLREVRECIMMYEKASQGFLKLDVGACVDALSNMIRRGEFVRVREIDGEIVGWLNAIPVNYAFIPHTVFQQQYFITDRAGYRSYRTTILLHEVMVERAIELGIRECYSMGNLMSIRGDAVNLAAALERVGWERHGYVARKKCHLI